MALPRRSCKLSQFGRNGGRHGRGSIRQRLRETLRQTGGNRDGKSGMKKTHVSSGGEPGGSDEIEIENSRKNGVVTARSSR
jgi:hypothetical protein